MTSSASHAPNAFAPPRRSEPLRIIIARGKQASSFTIRPLAAGLLGAGCLLLVAGYLASAGYLMLREDIKDATSLQQIRAARIYEDRIAELRARIEGITSRALIAQQTYEQQIATLKQRQGELDARHSRVADVLARAARSGLKIAGEGPIPIAKPSRTPSAAPVLSGAGIGGTNVPLDAASPIGLRGSVTVDGRDGKSLAMHRIDSALAVMDRQTATALDLIAVAAERKIARIETIAKSLGIALEKRNGAVGGPYEPLTGDAFETRLDRAERAIGRLSALRDGARSLPLGEPVPNAAVSSLYGPRVDPFLDSPAMHTGIDFRADYGTPIHATAAGKVMAAGRNGGYGLMVELDHGNGIVTRYGHMSRVRVAEGVRVASGQVIGYVGSTGRSTGAHLHYETRLASGPTNPKTFLDAGRKLAGLLD